MTLDLDYLEAVAKAADDTSKSLAEWQANRMEFQLYFGPPTVLAMIGRIRELKGVK